MAAVINKGGTDKTVVLAIREFCAQPIQAPDWTDLRVGFLLSLTKAANDDDPTGLAEDIGSAPPPEPLLPDTDRVRIGMTDRATGTTFIGYCNRPSTGRVETAGQSKLVSSDVGIGTTNAFFWRYKNSLSNNFTFQITDQGIPRGTSGDGSQIHFPQDTVNAGGYATLISMRLTRPNGHQNAKVITVQIKKATAGGHSGDVLFTNTPTKALLTSNLLSFPTNVQQFGPYTLSQEPDSLFLYWPFHNSRLRSHCMGFVQIVS